MKHDPSHLAFVLVLVLPAATAKTVEAGLFGIDSTADQIVSIDTSDSSALGIGSPGQLASDGFPFVEGLAFDPNANLLYGVNVSANDDRLVSIDPATGQATGIGADRQLFLDGFGFVEGLAFDPNTNTLYGCDTVSSQFLRIDTATGSGTAFGTFGTFANVAGLAFDPNTNTLYGVDTTFDQILTIDTATGIASGVGGSGQLQSDGFGAVTGLAFDALTNTLYGVDNLSGHDQILIIDTVTGAATPVGAARQLDSDGFSDVDGLAFTNASAVPEPSSVTLLVLSAIAAAILARRRRR